MEFIFCLPLKDKSLKMKTIVTTLFILFILVSCNKPAVPEISKLSINWDYIIIESGSQSIIIDKFEDYGVCDTCAFKKVEKEGHIIYEPINRGQYYFDINEQEKDSIFACVHDIVTSPVYTEQSATCYAGNISIGFRSRNTTLICKYNSVGNWSTISLSTQKLYALLKDKTKVFGY